MLRFTVRMYRIALTLRVKTNTLSSFSSCHMVYVSFFFFSFWRIMHTSFFSCQLCKRATAKVSCLRIRSEFDLHLHQNKKRNTKISVGIFFCFKKQGTFYLGWSKIAKQVRRVRVEKKSFKWDARGRVDWVIGWAIIFSSIKK